MIEVKDLVKLYDNHLAVDHLTFTVPKGQILGFLGPNGAGKSTTMNIITGYISATSGSVTINGHDIYEEPEEAKRSIGYLPEQPPVYMDMKVREYLNFVAELKKVPKKERTSQVEAALEKTKTMDVAGRLIKHLSKGYRQRVGIAQAIIGNPEVIILDEPTVGLDPMQIIEIRDLMKELAEEHTVILSSHILSEISAVCDTVMIINKGKLVVSDTVENLPKHLNAQNNCRLLLKGTKEQAEKLFAGMEAVKEVSVEEEEEGMVRVVLTSDSSHDVREKVFFACAGAGLPIYEMTNVTRNLEDIFLELTQGTEAYGKAVKEESAGTEGSETMEEKEENNNAGSL
ncbi:MAG: ATP-binding cassette domain-containing protein [Lachnospiraceae bacterium]|nr:ATP-binding cassette domain-containing protein [Lachnospiraceae bacterium]